MDYGTLRVTTPDGQVREYPVDVPSVFVGRAEGNRVVIDHVTVSRRHAHLTIDSGRLLVEDLGSANGTFLGSQRIAPNSPNLVEEGQSLRFGDVEAVFLPPPAAQPAVAPGAPVAGVPSPGFSPAPAPSPAAPTPSMPAPPPAPAGPAPSPFAAGPAASAEPLQPIGVSVISPSAPVAAGSPTTATVQLQNRGTVVDEFTISVPDLPAGWVRVSRPQLALLPGARDEVTIVIQPPKAPEALAGEYSFSVAVVSRQHGVEVRALARVTVLPFDAFSIALKPVRARRDFTLVARNEGNAVAAYSFAGADDEQALRYRFDPESVEIKPGEECPVRLHVGRNARRLFGKEEVKPFRVEAIPAAAGVQRQTVTGQLRSRGSLEPWKLPVAILLVLGLLGGGAWGYRRNCGDSWPLCPGGDSAKQVSPATTTPATATQPPATRPPGTTATTPPATPPTPSPAGLKVGGTAVVTNSKPVGSNNGNCLAVRDKPQVNPANPNEGVLRRLCDGAEVTILAGPKEDGTYRFWQVRDSAGDGWAAEGPIAGDLKFLVPK